MALKQRNPDCGGQETVAPDRPGQASDGFAPGLIWPSIDLRANPTPRPGLRAVHRYDLLSVVLIGLALTGCGSTPLPPALTSSGAPLPGLAAIETDAAGRCIGRAITPAVIETVTAQELDTPAVLGPDGAVVQPARYRSVIRQNITRDRQEVLFETICPPAFTHEFVSTLQRALATRGYYQGPITGVLDTATGRAVQDYQRGIGPDSPLLSIGAARALGIVSLSDEQLARLN